MKLAVKNTISVVDLWYVYDQKVRTNKLVVFHTQF